MPVNHQFVSGVSDGADATLVRPADWNATHTVTIADATEIPLGIPALVVASALNGAF